MELSNSITLAQVIENREEASRFFTSRMTGAKYFTSDEIAFEEVSYDARRLAPFVAPNVEGKIRRHEGSNLKAFKPAYVKPKDVVDVSKLKTRMPGEPLDFSQRWSMQQRRLAMRARFAVEQANEIDNTIEWMAAQAALRGQVTVSGENYPTTTVDFGRDPSLTRVLTGTARWGQADADTMGDIKEMRRSLKDLNGTIVREIYFSPEAYDAWYEQNAETIKDLLDTRYLGSDTQFTRFIDIGILDDVEYIGRIAGMNGQGEMRIFVMSAKFVREQDGQEERYLPPGAVFGVNFEKMQLTDCYGAIQDLHSDLVPAKYWPRNYMTTGDVALEYIKTESAPLVVPAFVNSAFLILTGAGES